MQLNLPTKSGRSEIYVLQGGTSFDVPRNLTFNRIAYSAAHVVADPFADNSPFLEPAIDWDKTIEYRRYLWSLGLGVAEAMARSLVPVADIITPNRFELTSLTARPVKIMSMARDWPMRRGRRTVPPSISGTPQRRQYTPRIAWNAIDTQSVTSISIRCGTCVLIQVTSCWKYASPRSMRPAPGSASCRSAKPPQRIDEFVTRCAIRNTPMGTMPESE